jgi:diacylglycerol kinase (ATP)
MALDKTHLRWQTRSMLSAFRHATEGVSYCLRTQRHMPHYFVVMFVALLLGIYLDVTPAELLFVFSAIMFVLMAEMLNTAAETIVDIVCPQRDDRARIAKDCSAGAVLIACCYAVAVFALVYLRPERVAQVISHNPREGNLGPAELAVIGIVLLVLVIISVKESAGRPGLLSGGPVSGHAALAFFMATCLCIAIDNKLWSVFGFLLATLVGQSRVEGGIHSLREVILGIVVGIGLALLVHQLTPQVARALL